MPLDPRIDEVRKKYGLSRDDFWELRQRPGTWIAKHAALELAAAKAEIIFMPPQILEANSAQLVCAMVVEGRTPDGRSEWSTGEASPSNYRVKEKQPGYPWAMSEKRAKDRVILKLIGLHGLAYSEEEDDDFKANGNGKVRDPDTGRMVNPRSANQAKKRGDWPAFEHELSECETVVRLAALRREYEENVYPTWSPTWCEQAEEAFEKRQAELTADDLKGTLEDSVSSSLPYQTKADYVAWCHEQIANAPNKAKLQEWWESDDEKAARRRFSLTQSELKALKDRVLDRINELSVELVGAG